MQRAWIHPELIIRDGTKHALRVIPTSKKSEESRPSERRPYPCLSFSRFGYVVDRSALFLSGACLSALVTFAISLVSSSDELSPLDIEKSDVGAYSSPNSHPVGRTSFLAKIFSSQERELKGQMKFLATIIESRLQSHPNPHQLALQIVTESLHADYDPVFVAAVINAESTFKHQAISGRGARGLMQIMPETARFISRVGNVSWQGDGQLNEPIYNLRLGIAYLKYLETKFKGSRERMLIAYNWGAFKLRDSFKKWSPSSFLPSRICTRYSLNS